MAQLYDDVDVNTRNTAGETLLHTALWKVARAGAISTMGR